MILRLEMGPATTRLISRITFLISFSLIIKVGSPILSGQDVQKTLPNAANIAPQTKIVSNKVAPAIKPAQTTAANIQPLLQAALAVAPKVLTNVKSAPTPNVQKGQKQPVKSTAGANAARAPALPPQSNLKQEEIITHLDYSNINDEILNKRTANLVYFNANFNKCANCNRFYNIWKELALDIRWWRRIIRLFMINCSDDDNIDICRRAGVTQFPQLKFYWVMSGSLNQDGQRLRILGKSVHAMRHLITDKLLDSYLEHNRLMAQRDQQSASTAALAGPLGTLTSLISPSPSGQGANALSSLLPLMSQFLPGPPRGASNSSAPHQAGGGLLTGMASMMGKGQPAGGGPSGGSLMGLMGSFGSMQGITQMINALVGLVSWRRSLSLQPLPSNWPELEQIETSDVQQLLNMLPLNPAKGIGALLIMETQEFLYTGLEVMLDLNPYSNQTYIARVRDERSQLSKNLTGRDDIQAPALIYVTEHREVRLITTAPKYSSDGDLRRVFVRAFERRQGKHLKRVWSSSSTQNQIGVRSQEDDEIIGRMNNLYMADLLNTIRASLLDQVLRHTDLNEDQYNALVKYVQTLINYFPFGDDERLKFFKRLHAWLQNQVSPIDMADYKKQFHDVDEVLGKKREWMACKSLSSINAIPKRGRKSVGAILFENPAQLGKVVSNITRLFRTNQQKVGQLKNLVGMFAGNLNPVALTSANQQQGNQQAGLFQRPSTTTTSTTTTTTTAAPTKKNAKKEDSETSSVEKLLKSLTSGSLGSDSSILKLITNALTGEDDSGTFDNYAPASGSKGGLGKSKFAREYSCGAWKLAHVMVVNEYLKDSPRKDVKHTVLHSLYQYMLHFYACPTCGNRVSDIAGEFRLQLGDHLLDQSDSVMLLWKLHNRVNKRLEVEFRPGSPPKQQFPSESACAKCRSAKANQNDSALVGTAPNWQEKQVLHFLVHHYWPQNIITTLDSAGTSSAALRCVGQNVLLAIACTLFASHLAVTFRRNISSRSSISIPHLHRH